MATQTSSAWPEKIPTILALDLEGTLISNAVSQIPRPGLSAFLTACRELFPRIVMFTTVREPLFRSIARGLVDEGAAPDWFAAIEYVEWSGPTKDLSVIPAVRPPFVLLVDDHGDYVHPGQESMWVPIPQFCSPYSGLDDELAATLGALTARVAQHQAARRASMQFASEDADPAHLQQRRMDYERVYLAVASIVEQGRDVEHAMSDKPVRTLGNRTLVEAIRAGDAEKALRYLQSISNGANG